MSWSFADNIAESLCEFAGVAVADLRGDVDYLHIGVQEKLRSPEHLPVFDICIDRAAAYLTESFLESCWVHSETFGELLNSIMRHNIPANKLRGGESFFSFIGSNTVK